MASATVFRAGFGLLGGREQTIPHGELAALWAALREEDWGSLLVTDHANHVRGWRDDRIATLNSPLANRWRGFWEAAEGRGGLQLLWTPSHRDSTLAADLHGGRPPELYLGNAFADSAAGVRSEEGAATTDMGFADAIA